MPFPPSISICLFTVSNAPPCLPLQGVVYLRYGDAASGQAAYLKMHGRWFDGRSLIAEYLPEATYAIRFPDAPKA